MKHLPGRLRREDESAHDNSTAELDDDVDQGGWFLSQLSNGRRRHPPGPVDSVEPSR